MNNNDRWSALSMKDRAALIDIYVKSGITDLGEIRKSYNGIPYRDFNTSEYDYFNAHPDNAPTKEGEHWTSRNPHTGRLLKREDHPTFDLMIEGEKQAGYKVIKGYNGELYSIPNEPNNYVEDYNSFDEGGNTEPLYYDDTYIEPAVVTGYKTPPIIKTLGDYSTYNFINSMIEKNNERYKNNDSKSKSIATKLIPVIVGNSLFNGFGNGGRMLDGTEEEQTLSGKKPNTVNKLLKQYLFGDISDDEVRRRLYHNVEPHNYKFYDGESSVKRIKDAVKKNESEYDKLMEGYNSFSESRDDIYAEYLQIPKSERHNIEGKIVVSDANYSPTKGTSENLKKINLNEDDITYLVDSGLQLKHGENKVDNPLAGYFADHTVGRGFDNKGDYVSYYDLWDLNPYKGKYAHPVGTLNLVPKKIKEIGDLSLGIGNPTEYYDRIYLDDYFNVPEEARGAPFITPAVVTAKKTNRRETNKFATGGPTENNWEIPFSLESTTVPITKYDYYTLAPEAVQIPIRDIKQKYAMAPELIALDEEVQIAELKERAAKEYSFGVSSDVLDDIGNQERVNKRMLTNIYHNNQPDDFKYINSSEVDTSPKIKITAPNTNISKFIYGNNISEEAIKEIKQVASKRGLDPYDILAHMLIESSGEFNGITRNSYFNTHDVLERQISPRLLDPNNSRNIETLLRNLGVYNESRQYTNEEIRDYILDYGKQLQEAVSNLEYPSSTIDAVGLRMSKFGRDFNPAQKGFKSSKGEVKNSYLDMINSAITSLKENMPDLFK